MPSPGPKRVSIRQESYHTSSLGTWEEFGNVNGGGKVTDRQLRRKIHSKKKAKHLSNVDINKVD